MPSTEFWAGIGSVLAFILALISMALNHERITLWMNMIKSFFSPYIKITIPEYGAEYIERSNFYVAIEAYLSEHCCDDVRKLKGELGSQRRTPLFYVDDGQQIIDTFPKKGGGGGGGGGSEPGPGGGEPGHGGSDDDKPSHATVWWHAYKEPPVANVLYRPGEEERRFYRVSFHRRFRETVKKHYLPYVIDEGRRVIDNKRQHRLFTNNPFPYSGWSHVPFQHPATFDTLAMDPKLKQTILDDLDTFKNRKSYYASVGKPWKRGYLLFGPPGTGKSTMISAMANKLEYDVYDLELTAVKSNNELRKLFLRTTGKSIIVVEDIDCSVDLTGKRRGKKKQARKKTATGEGSVANMIANQVYKNDDDDDDSQQLTLSGVLNIIDGLWSACGGERIIVFTTNNKDQLDPALIRRGRMDMHIEMSYCSYEAFKILANNYLQDIDDQQMFEWFSKIQELLEVAKMSPADVAEHLMHRENDSGACLKALVVALEEKVGEAARMEAMEKFKDEEAVEDKQIKGYISEFELKPNEVWEWLSCW